MKILGLLGLLGSCFAGKIPLQKHQSHQASFAQKFLVGEKIDIQDTNEDLLHYSINVQIGNPPQSFDLVPDITHPYTFVYGKKCWSLPCFYRHLYDHTKSSTYSPPQSPVPPKMAGLNLLMARSINLDLGVEKVSIGSEQNGTAQNLIFGEVTKISGNSFAFANVSGVIGLGFHNSTANQHAPGFMDLVGFTNKTFSFYLNDDERYMTLPGIDEDKYEIVQSHDVQNKEKYFLYLLNLTHVTTKNNKKVVFEKGNAGPVLNFPYMIGPDEFINDVLDGVYLAKDCSNLKTLPQITLTFDDTDYTLDPEDYVIKKGNKCKLGIMSQKLYTNAPEGFFFLGEPFLKKYPPMYDMVNNKVHFQRKKKAVDTQFIQ